MRIGFHLIYFLVFIFSCTIKSEKSSSKNDSSGKVIVQKLLVNNEEPDLDSIVENFQKLYRVPYVIDTIFFIDNDTFKIRFKHYCLLDSSISLPKRYLSIYKLKSFITHNFESIIQIRRDDNLILDKIIGKKDFTTFLDSELMSYGVLLFPEIKKKGGEIIVDYSISIPLLMSELR